MRMFLFNSNIFLLLFVLIYQASADSLANTRPNIIFVLSDDMGWNEPAFNGGNPEWTPNLDRLRNQGASLEQFYVHAVCAPTRAAFLTGRYAFRTWSDWRSEDYGKPSYLAKLGLQVAQNDKGKETRMVVGLDTEERTIAEALKEAGYFTALAGKWHCGEWLPEHLPMGQGFDHQYGHYGWGIDYHGHFILHNAPARYAVYDWHRNQKPVREHGYSTDLIATEVVRLIAEHKERNRDMPFFHYVSFNAIHGPLDQIPRYTDRYEKRFAALKCMDDALGNILGALDQYGFAENTLVIFCNDNGGLRQEHSDPYRGTKNTNYEGGVRVPCLLRWPGKIEPGSSNDGLMHITDFFSTFIHLAGASVNQERKPDGLNQCDMLFKGGKSPRQEIIFEVSGSVRPPAIRVNNYKLVGDELYDLIKDPYERSDLALKLPKMVERLKKRVQDVSKERPPMPDLSILMDPPLPWVYGKAEDANTPVWLKEYMKEVRSKQPHHWEPGTTPWPQAPKDGKILYTGDGR